MAAYVRAVLLARDKRLFLNVTPRRRKKRLIIEVSDFDAALAQKAIAEGLKRDVRFLGPHGFQKITVRHQLGRPVAAVPDWALASHGVQRVRTARSPPITLIA